MKIYALIHGVCGLAEGYSETECYFHDWRADALKDQAQWLSEYTKAPHEEVIINADRDEIIIVRNDDEGDHVILQIVELHPMWDTGRDADNVTTEWFVWNQIDSEPHCDDYLPSDMGCIRTALEAIEFQAPLPGRGRARTFDLDVFKDFFNDLRYTSQSTLDCDDLCLHFFRIQKNIKQ